jgi:PPM family protein phosphatase
MELPTVRRRGRTWLVLLSVLVVLIGAGALARLWVLQQYYVGVSGNQLAIYQGVRGSVLGIPLQNLWEGSCPPGATGCTELSLNDLQETARSAVRDGIISGNGLQGARATVARLRKDEMLPPCPVTPPAAPANNAAPAGTPDHGADHGATPTGQNPPPGQGATAGAPTQTPETTTLPSVPPQPGKTCRPVS